MRGQGRYRHPPAGYVRIRRDLRIAWPVLTGWAAQGLDLRQITPEHVRAELDARTGHNARGVHHVLRSIFRALRQQRIIFADPIASVSISTPVRLPAPLPTDRLRGVLERLDKSSARLIVGLVAIHAIRVTDVARLVLEAPDLARGTLIVPRGERTHTIHLDDLTTTLINDWLAYRHRRWPHAPNPHLLISTHTRPPPRKPALELRRPARAL